MSTKPGLATLEIEDSARNQATPDITIESSNARPYFSYSFLQVLFLLRPSDYQRRVRILKYILVSVVVTALFVATIMLRLRAVPEEKTNGKPNSRSRAYDRKQLDSCNNTCGTQNPTTLECIGLDLSNGSEQLLQELERLNDLNCTTVELTLRYVKFANNELISGWLPLTSAHPDIITLYIYGSVQNIGECSFSSFKKLQKLALTETKITFLRAGSFQGLSTVWDFTLRNNMDLTGIESGLLREFTLTSLLLEGWNFTDQTFSEAFFKNLTADKELSSLIIFQIGSSNLKTFRTAFIRHFPYIVSLYLLSNDITTLDKDVFDYLPHLKQAHLTGNEIEVVQEDIFRKYVEKPNTSLYIATNPIICDCELQWLKEFIIENVAVGGDVRTINCRNFGKTILEAEFCGNSPTTTTIRDETTENPQEPTKTITEATTTSTSGGTTQKPTDSTILCTSDTNYHRMEPPIIKMSNSKNPSKISIQDRNSDTIDLELTINSSKNLVAVTYVCLETEVNCSIICNNLEKTQKTFVAKNLRASTDYFFCAIGTDGNLTLEDCTSYRTQPEYGGRAWFTNAEKPLTITYACLTIFIIFIVGAMAAFCLVRKKPTLLRGSGRVEVVKSRDGEMVLVMPESRASTPSTPNSVYDTISGYISVIPPYMNGKGTPPPIPPYPPNWMLRNREEHDYLEPRRLARLPKNVDLLLEYELYTQQYRPESRK